MAKDKDTGIIYYLPKSASTELRNHMEDGVRRGFVRKLEFNTPAQIALAWAKRGDWECLAHYIEASRMGTSEMRAFLVAVLRGKIKRPINRPPSFKKVATLIERVQFFLALQEQGIPRERAIDTVSKEFNVDRRTIQRDLKEGEAAVEVLITIKQLAAKAEADNGGRQYVVSNAALTTHFLSRR